MMVVMYASQQAVSPKVHVMHADAAKKPTKITETELLNSAHCDFRSQRFPIDLPCSGGAYVI